MAKNAKGPPSRKRPTKDDVHKVQPPAKLTGPKRPAAQMPVLIEVKFRKPMAPPTKVHRMTRGDKLGKAFDDAIDASLDELDKMADEAIAGETWPMFENGKFVKRDENGNRIQRGRPRS